MKRKIRNLFILVVLIIASVIVIDLLNNKGKDIVLEQMDPLKAVKNYEPVVEEELAKQQLEEYTPVVLALMQQESHGKGGDPMQASESAGLAPNSINDPKESIAQGIKHFENMLDYGEKEGVDFATVLQAYNMGPGYIKYVASHGGKHTEGLAKQFSLAQVKKNPKLYNCGGNKNNFRYPYCYGDFTYSEKVEANVKSLTDSVPVYLSTNKEKSKQ